MLKINRSALISRHCHHFSSRLLSSFGNISRNKSSVSVNDALQKNEDDEISRNKLDSKEFSQSPKLDLYNAEVAFANKSTSELLRAYVVFQLCRVPWIVNNAQWLLDCSNSVLGKGFTNYMLKLTFFSHFCAGATIEDLKPKVGLMREYGVGSILDYAAENSVRDEKNNNDLDREFRNSMLVQPARVYEYENEEECDRNLDVFRSCIHAVKNVAPSEEGFAAMKVTALGHPMLLERLSTAIVEIENLFNAFDTDCDGFVSHEEFDRSYRHYFFDGDEMVSKYLEMLDPSNSGRVDLVNWSQHITPLHLSEITSSCKELGPLARASLSSEEVKLAQNLIERASKLGKEASEFGVRLLIDAEQTYVQPAISHIALDLQLKYNAKEKVDRAFIFNTYQMYLKGSLDRLKSDIERSNTLGYHFAAKLVRGAYMYSERERAENLGYENPIHETIEDTHESYDKAIQVVMHHRALGNNSEMLLGTHNEASVNHAVTMMNNLCLNHHGIYFAQLLGMADHLTYNLGEYGYKSYKYVPYGNVEEVMPYLVRRMEENGSLLRNLDSELDMIQKEIGRRLYG